MDRHNPDLIYCINGRIYRGEKPWVVDFETPSVFFGFIGGGLSYAKKISKDLASCSALLPYSQAGAIGFRGIYGEGFNDKLVVSRNLVQIPKEKRQKHFDYRLRHPG